MSARPRVLITKRIFPEAVEFLERSFDVDYNGTDRVLPSGELIERARGCQAIVSQLTDRLDAGVIAQLEGVRIIANVAVGYDNIDVAAATARGIAVTNTPGVLTETTADFAFALLMAAARRIPEAHAFVHSGQWRTWIIDLLAGQDVYGATLGIFGFGRIGAAVARRGRGFGMRILYCDEQPAPAEVERELEARRVSKEELLRESDFVSLHVPLTPATRHLISRAELALMKPTAILINTARGPVVDEEALVEALERRIIWAAGLDVFENEPAVHPRLLELPNVVLAPHIASASYATRRRMSMMAAENAAAALSGKRPPNLLNPGVWPAEELP
ncbi:MAG: D-glycerate dehydrogenase [Bryobacteraceae bacterium]|nr:D-glycerate dehydrogenase [Bryobacteraceae bacterium]MCX7605545.1 D-glycerate dehydrogenase [Bryobacteraceae bacterium]